MLAGRKASVRGPNPADLAGSVLVKHPIGLGPNPIPRSEVDEILASVAAGPWSYRGRAEVAKTIAAISAILEGSPYVYVGPHRHTELASAMEEALSIDPKTVKRTYTASGYKLLRGTPFEAAEWHSYGTPELHTVLDASKLPYQDVVDNEDWRYYLLPCDPDMSEVDAVRMTLEDLWIETEAPWDAEILEVPKTTTRRDEKGRRVPGVGEAPVMGTRLETTYRALVPVCPAGERDTTVPTEPAYRALLKVERHLRKVLDQIPESAYAQRPEVVFKKMNSLAMATDFFVMYDFKKCGLTYPHALINLVFELLPEENLFEGWKVEIEPGHVIEPVRGYSLGFFSAGITLLNIALAKLAWSRVAARGEMDFLVYHDDQVFGFTNRYDREDFDEVYSLLVEKVGGVLNRKKSIRSDHGFVFLEEYYTKRALKRGHYRETGVPRLRNRFLSRVPFIAPNAFLERDLIKSLRNVHKDIPLTKLTELDPYLDVSIGGLARHDPDEDELRTLSVVSDHPEFGDFLRVSEFLRTYSDPRFRVTEVGLIADSDPYKVRLRNRTRKRLEGTTVLPFSSSGAKYYSRKVRMYSQYRLKDPVRVLGRLQRSLRARWPGSMRGRVEVHWRFADTDRLRAEMAPMARAHLAPPHGNLFAILLDEVEVTSYIHDRDDLSRSVPVYSEFALFADIADYERYNISIADADKQLRAWGYIDPQPDKQADEWEDLRLEAIRQYDGQSAKMNATVLKKELVEFIRSREEVDLDDLYDSEDEGFLLDEGVLLLDEKRDETSDEDESDSDYEAPRAADEAAAVHIDVAQIVMPDYGSDSDPEETSDESEGDSGDEGPYEEDDFLLDGDCEDESYSEYESDESIERVSDE